MTHRAIALLPLLTTGLAFADTITVCPDGTCDHVDIASAVAAATAGDVIAVGAGTYAVSTPIELDDRDLVIEGPADGGKGLAVVIDGLDASSAFVCRNGDATTFRNLSFTNGRGSDVTFPGVGTFSVGGAVQNFDASPSFEGCRFANGVAEGGGAVFAFGSGTLGFDDCVFESNLSTAEGGGAILAFGSEAGALSLQVTNCDFLLNEAAGDVGGGDEEGSYGGAISVLLADLHLADSQFTGNVSSGFGGALGLEAGDQPGTVLLVEGCEFIGNEVESLSCFDTGLGGAVFLDDHFNATFSDCVFIDNRTSDCGSSAIWVQEGSPVFENCSFLDHTIGQDVLTANVATTTFLACEFTGNGLTDHAVRFLSTTATMVDCTISGNGSAGIRNAQGGVLTLEGCTLRDNAGAAVVSSNDVDVEVLNSLVCGNNAGGDQLVGGFITIDKFSTVESQCPSDLPGDLDGDGAVSGSDLATLAASWGTDDPTADVDGSGEVNGADMSILLSNWTG